MITNVTMFSLLMQFASVDGHVRDARTHKPLQLVRIELSQLGAASNTQYTDLDGRFHFPSVMAGNYTITAVSIGYESRIVDLSLQGGDSLEIELTPTAHHNQGVPPVVSVREYMNGKTAREEFEKAKREIKRRDCAKAVVHLENGLRFEDQAAALNDLGNCYIRLGEVDRAEASFRHATELSNSVYIALNLAEVYVRQKRLDDAAIVLHTAIQKSTDNGDAYYGLAVIYFNGGRLREARTAGLQAESRPHRVADLHLLLAKIYSQTDPQNVLGQLQLYLKEAPDGAESERVRQAVKAGKSK